MGHRILSSNSSVGDLLAELSTADASHGAVAASAVAAGMGSALLVMVAALPKTRSGSIDDRTTLTTIAAALIDLRKQLVDVLDAEITGRMFAARRMPQVTQTQRAERDAAIQLALRTAAHVPLEVMRLSVLGLKHGQTVAEHACRAASSDMELAVALLRVGMIGARSNLELKLGSLTDVKYTEAVVNEIARLTDEGTRAADAAESLLRVPPA